MTLMIFRKFRQNGHLYLHVKGWKLKAFWNFFQPTEKKKYARYLNKQPWFQPLRYVCIIHVLLKYATTRKEKYITLYYLGRVFWFVMVQECGKPFQDFHFTLFKIIFFFWAKFQTKSCCGIWTVICGKIYMYIFANYFIWLLFFI